MNNLFRIINKETWIEAKKSGYIPRCGNDNKIDRIHLNVLEAVEFVATTYFQPEECPLALEVDISGFSDKIEWLAPGDEFKWEKALARIPNLPVSSVINVHQLESVTLNGKNSYRLILNT